MRRIFTLLLSACIFNFSSAQSNYNGNTNTGFGGTIGTSTLSISDDGTIINFTLTRGSAAFNDALTIYIDSKAGGSSNTSLFVDQGDYLRRAISGINGSGRSTINFPTSPAALLPDYAIALCPSGSATFGGLWELVNVGSHNFLASVNLTPNNNTTATTYTFSVDKGLLGITGTVNFNFVATYGNPNNGSGYFRSNEGYGEGLPATNPGVSDVTFSSFLTYPLIITPLELNSLSATIVNDKVELRWATYSESNLEKFIVQKSNNGLNFTDLAIVAPKNIAGGAPYLYTDGQPNFGNTYYRIIAKTLTAEKAYSKIVKVVYGKLDNTLTVFPNPTSELVKINLIGAARGKYSIDILNDIGQKLIRQTMDHNGIDRVITIPLPVNLKKGPYRVYISNQTEFYKGTFIVQ
jgi:hypothetical protein